MATTRSLKERIQMGLLCAKFVNFSEVIIQWQNNFAKPARSSKQSSIPSKRFLRQAVSKTEKDPADL